MTSIVEQPPRIQDTDRTVSLDDLLGTIKIIYTITACGPCGRMVMLNELTTPIVREAVAA